MTAFDPTQAPHPPAQPGPADELAALRTEVMRYRSAFALSAQGQAILPNN